MLSYKQTIERPHSPFFAFTCIDVLVIGSSHLTVQTSIRSSWYSRHFRQKIQKDVLNGRPYPSFQTNRHLVFTTSPFCFCSIMTLSSQLCLEAKRKCENRKVDQGHFFPSPEKGRIDRESFAVVYLQSTAGGEGRRINSSSQPWTSFHSFGVPKKRIRV